MAIPLDPPGLDDLDDFDLVLSPVFWPVANADDDLVVVLARGASFGTQVDAGVVEARDVTDQAVSLDALQED